MPIYSLGMSDAIKTEIVKKTLPTLRRWSDANKNVKRLEAELEAAKAQRETASDELVEIGRAAKVFGLSYSEIMDEYFKAVATDDESRSVPSPIAQFQSSAPRTIREAVLALAESQYPKPVHAADLRKTLENQRGEALHEKTVGMTLYRLAGDGLMRRQGRKDWFFVPPEERAKNPGGDTPGPINRDDEKEGNA